MLFKKGYLGRKRTTEPGAGATNGYANGYANGNGAHNGYPNGSGSGSTNGDGALHNGGVENTKHFLSTRLRCVVTLFSRFLTSIFFSQRAWTQTVVMAPT